MPYLLVGVLTTGAVLAIGLSLSEGPVTTFDGTTSLDQCLKSVTAETPVTVDGVASCKGRSVTTNRKGGGVTIVKLDKHQYVIRVGDVPARMPIPIPDKLLLHTCYGTSPKQTTSFSFSS